MEAGNEAGLLNHFLIVHVSLDHGRNATTVTFMAAIFVQVLKNVVILVADTSMTNQLILIAICLA